MDVEEEGKWLGKDNGGYIPSYVIAVQVVFSSGLRKYLPKFLLIM